MSHRRSNSDHSRSRRPLPPVPARTELQRAERDAQSYRRPLRDRLGSLRYTGRRGCQLADASLRDLDRHCELLSEGEQLVNQATEEEAQAAQIQNRKRGERLFT